MWMDAGMLVLGVACAGAGGELFVRGAVGLARWMRVPAGIIAATVAAFATSSPELAVAVSAASAGRPEISLGDALGSNIANVALILGAALLFRGIDAPRASIRRDFPVALLAPILLGGLALDGIVSRLDAVVLLATFAAWLWASLREARRERSAAPQVLADPGGGRASLRLGGGLALLVAAGWLIVRGASGLALAMGLSAFVVGATVVALATSAPELATTLVARYRGHDEVGLGTILGSNIFNLLFIASVAAGIHPISVRPRQVGFGVLFGVATLAAARPDRHGRIGRGWGIALLAMYVAYVATTLRAGYAVGSGGGH